MITANNNVLTANGRELTMFGKHHTSPLPFHTHHLHVFVIPQLSFQDGEPEWSKVREVVLVGAAKDSDPQAQPGAH